MLPLSHDNPLDKALESGQIVRLTITSTLQEHLSCQSTKAYRFQSFCFFFWYFPFPLLLSVKLYKNLIPIGIIAHRKALCKSKESAFLIFVIISTTIPFCCTIIWKYCSFYGWYCPNTFLNRIFINSLFPLKKLIFVGVFPVLG